MPVLTKINTNVIANDAITSAKVAGDVIAAGDIADDAVGTAELENDVTISTSGNIATTGSGTLTVAGVTTLTGTLAAGAQGNITGVGTIASGVWEGTDVGVAHGGTGLSAAAKGSVIVANAANTISALDGGGSNDGFLAYTSSSDTIAWSTIMEGGTF